MPKMVSLVQVRLWRAEGAVRTYANTFAALAVQVQRLTAAVEELAPLMRKVWISARRMQLSIWLVRLIPDEVFAQWLAERTPDCVILRLPLQGFEQPRIPGVG